MSCLSEQEVGILNRVIDKFSGFTSQRIIDYMHQEDAYKNTEDGEVISYELAKRVELNLG